MQYGICNLSLVPLRLEPSESSELVSQLLYGDHFKVLEQRKSWSKIRIAFDTYEGWIDNKQFFEISKNDYSSIQNSNSKFSIDLVEFILDDSKELYPILLGSSLSSLSPFWATMTGSRTI